MKEKDITRTLQLVRSAGKGSSQSKAQGDNAVMPSLDEPSIGEIFQKAFRHKMIFMFVFCLVVALAILAFAHVGTWYQRSVTAQFNNYENNSLFQYLDTFVPAGDDDRPDNPQEYATRATSALASDEFLSFLYDQMKSDKKLSTIIGISSKAEKMDKATYKLIKEFMFESVVINSSEKTSGSGFLGLRGKGSFKIVFKDKSYNNVDEASDAIVRIMNDYLAKREVSDIQAARLLVNEKLANSRSDIASLSEKRKQLQRETPPTASDTYNQVELALQGARTSLAGNSSLEARFAGLMREIESKISNINQKGSNDAEVYLLKQELAGLNYKKQLQMAQGYDPESSGIRDLNVNLQETAEKLKELTKVNRRPSGVLTSPMQGPDSGYDSQIGSAESLKEQSIYYKAKADKLQAILVELKEQINDRLSKELEKSEIEKQIAGKQKLVDHLESALIRLDLADFKTLRRLEFFMNPIEEKTILPLGSFALLVALLAFFMATTVAFSRERNNPSLATVRSFEELGIPILGGLPSTDTYLFDAQTGMHNDPQSLSYMRVGINLGNTLAFMGSKIVLFTGADTARQSATVAYNLAMYYAQTNRKVLIVDADFQNNYLSRMTGASLRGGLNDILSSSTEVSIKPFEIQKGLHLLTGDPSTLPSVYRLASEQFLELLNELKKEYDYVFIHARPCLEGPDAADLSRYAGVSIICCDSKTVKISLLERLTVEMRLFLTKYSYFVLENAEDKTTSYNRTKQMSPKEDKKLSMFSKKRAAKKEEENLKKAS